MVLPVALVIALAVGAATPEAAPADPHALARAVAAEPTEVGRAALIDGNRSLVTHDLVEALLDEGDAAVKRADLADALRLYDMARQIAVGLGDSKGAADATMTLGVTAGQQGDYAVAIARFRDVFDDAGAHHNPAGQSTALNNLGIVHRRLGDLDLALDDFARSLKIYETVADPVRRAILSAHTLNNIGVVLVQQGKYRSALQHFERSLALKKQVQAEDVPSTLANIGELHEQQGNFDLALDYYQQSLRAYEAQGVRFQSVEALIGIGRVSASRGEFDRALEYYRRALAIAERAADKDQIGAVHLSIGIALSRQGQPAAALAAFERSLALRESIGDRAGVAETLIQISIVEMRQRRHPDALASAIRAEALAKEVGHRVQRWKALTLVGQAQQALGHLAAARASWLDAIADIEAMRDEVAGGEEETERFLEWRLEPYYALIDLDVSLGRAADALAAAERVRGRVLLDALRYGRANVGKSMTADERSRERDLRRNVVSATARLDAARARPHFDAAQLDELTTALADARVAQDAYRDELYAARPELPVQRGDVPEIHPDEIASILPSGKSAALEFAVTSEHAYLFVIRRVGATVDIEAFSAPIAREALTTRVDTFRRRLAARDLTIRSEARSLFVLLMHGAETLIADRTTLIILPDGPLWALPFQALQSAPGRYLIEQAAISYAPSLSVLREMQRVSRSRSDASGRRTLLAIGSSGAGAAGVSASDAPGALAPLLEAEAQARAVGAIYGPAQSTVRVGERARSDWLLSDVGSYRVVHIAAHAVLDDASPLHSYLVLTPPSVRAPESGEPGDQGLVEAADLMKLTLRSDLVVLSGCDTARGRIGDGEGLIGLSWALFVAGAPSLVVSQWSVAAASTTDLMRAFHRRIVASLGRTGAVDGRAAALRQAALSLLRSPQYAHPFYWAAFVIVGDGS